MNVPKASLATLGGLWREPRFDQRFGHYFLIDFIRGLSALAVVFWHYQHFFYPIGARLPANGYPDAQPFADTLMPLYMGGHYAVQLFWLISGFVFAAVYGDRQVTTRDFVVNRFARLYPLHFVTLIVVALLQFVSWRTSGTTMLYDNNDVKHFILNVFLASRWGFEDGVSFNAPIWSVSVEIVIYALFWLALPLLLRRGIMGPVLIAMACLFIASLDLSNMIGLCGFYFFLGSTIFVLHNVFRETRWVQLLGAAAMVGAAVADLSIFSTPHIFMVVTPGLCGGLLLALAALEDSGLRAYARKGRWVGDATYSIYLCHVPLQLLLLIGLPLAGVSMDIARSPWFLLAFIATVLAIGRVSYVFFEKPARDWIRTRSGGGAFRLAKADPGIDAP